MSPRPTGATLVVRSEGPMWSSAPTGRRGKPYQPPGPAAHSGAFATRSQGMGRNRSRDHPQRGHQPRAIPQSRPLAVTAPFAQGSLGDGGCGLPRRPCGPPRNDNGFLSFRGAERRGNPSFLRWTGDGPPRSSAPTGATLAVSGGAGAGFFPPFGGHTAKEAARWAASFFFTPAGRCRQIGRAHV